MFGKLSSGFGVRTHEEIDGFDIQDGRVTVLLETGVFALVLFWDHGLAYGVRDTEPDARQWRGEFLITCHVRDSRANGSTGRGAADEESFFGICA
jgi:hypothetical protein